MFDVTLALLLASLLAFPLLLLSALLVVLQGRPILHASARMRSPEQSFTLWKFRTMSPVRASDRPTGGDLAARITPLGRFLRPLRLDEAPQLWNILAGDMSFVGPRPPLPSVVARHPALYEKVLQCRPGLTGLATLHFQAHESRLLAPCRSAAETESVYDRRCVPRKARLDLIYLRRRSFRLDLLLLGGTLRLLHSRGRKPAPIPRRSAAQVGISAPVRQLRLPVSPAAGLRHV